MSKKQVLVRATVEINLETWVGLEDSSVDGDYLKFMKSAVYSLIEREARNAVLAMDTFDAYYVIDEVLVNGEYV